MNIHPLWYICSIVRLLIIFVIYKIHRTNKDLNFYTSLILLCIGFGFIYQGYFSSNNTVQFSKVFWHNTRYAHGMFYLTSSYYLHKNEINISAILLFCDICFSVLYRIINDTIFERYYYKK